MYLSILPAQRDGEGCRSTSMIVCRGERFSLGR